MNRNKIIIADTGPLIALTICDLLQIIPKLLGTVYIPNAVYQEVTADPLKTGTNEIIKAVETHIIRLEPVSLSEPFKELISILDQGEAEAIALASKLKAVLLIDEKKGRKVAQQYHIPLIGSAAVLIQAKKMNFIDAVLPFLEKLKVHGYRLSNNLIHEILVRCNEIQESKQN